MNSSYSISRSRRHHVPEFKQELVAHCQPEVSVSTVTLAHGVNVNLLRQISERLESGQMKERRRSWQVWLG